MPSALRRPPRPRVVLCLAAWAALCPPALADGGSTIASAPTLLYGQRETPGGESGTLWRLNAFAGDELTLRVEEPQVDTLDLKRLHVDVFDPSVDDARLAGAVSVATADVVKSGALEITLSVPFTGVGALMVCVRRFGDCRTGRPAAVWGFAFTAAVAHRTTLSLAAPRTAGARDRIRVVARVRSPAGVPSGRCVVEGVTARLRRGECRLRLAAASIRGRRLRARFVPAPGWLPSSATRAIRVRTGSP